MVWGQLLQKENDTITLPYLGESTIITYDRGWSIIGKLPEEHGWHLFQINGRKLKYLEPSSQQDILKNKLKGYLIGNKFIPDKIDFIPKLNNLNKFEEVNLIEPGLDKFVRVCVGRISEQGQLIYENQEMPIGPESDLLQAYLDDKESIDNIPNVHPALSAAFKIETWIKKEANKRRKEEQELREKEERRKQIIETLGDGQSRRELAKEDFDAGARAALAVGGAELIDTRKSNNKNEMVVRFRLIGRRFECVCNRISLRIVDSGICLSNHDYDNNEWIYGYKGDNSLTLESISSIIRLANNEGKLVVFRHA